MARARAAAAAKAARRRPDAATRQRVHRFVRWDTPYVLPKATGDGGIGLAFTLDSVVNSAEFTALFDEYRIVEVEVMFILTGTTTPGGTCPIMYLNNDYDDIATPTITTILQTESSKIVPFSATRPVIRHKLVPSYVDAVGMGGKAGTWCDVAYPSNRWFGVKGWVANYNSSVYTGTYIQMSVKYTMEFRSVR